MNVYRFAKPDAHRFLDMATDLVSLKMKIESTLPLGALSYRLDQSGEGWVYAGDRLYGYIDQGATS